MERVFALIGIGLLASGVLLAEPPNHRVVPRPGQQASFLVRGEEQAGWHFGANYPRPFFYPFKGSNGTPLTRMGHPGAPNHDHHRSIWFAHHDVDGSDFWGDNTSARIRQKQWLVYQDGEQEAVMGVLLGWYDGEGKEIMEQELVAAWRAGSQKIGPELELQSTFRPKAAAVTLGKTNFGFLGVRMAKDLSVHFGEGMISDSEGRNGEKEIFGQRARWVAYTSRADDRGKVRKGVVYFDHPSNPRYPSYWHVREDGWMGASFGMKEAYTIKRENPLCLRYLLLASGEFGSRKSFDQVAASFAERGPFEIGKSTRPHRQFEVRRVADLPSRPEPENP